ncbi:uncharacterized protein METZ01_LOCUS171792, partial [marine metagenome]
LNKVWVKFIKLTNLVQTIRLFRNRKDILEG